MVLLIHRFQKHIINMITKNYNWNIKNSNFHGDFEKYTQSLFKSVIEKVKLLDWWGIEGNLESGRYPNNE